MSAKTFMGESFYGSCLMDWLREVCIVETDDDVYYDAESSDEKTVDLFIQNLKAQNLPEENDLLERLSFETAEDFLTYLSENEDGLCLAQKMVAAAFCTSRGIEIDEDTCLYVEEQLYYFNDSRDVHYEIEVDIDLG